MSRVECAAVLLMQMGQLACGRSSAEVCSNEIPSGSSVIGADCESAWKLAKRTAAGLVLSRDEVDFHIDIYQRGYEPLAAILARPPIATDWYGSLTAVATAEPFLMAWSQGQVMTGVPTVDDVLARAFINEVIAQGSGFFTFYSSHVMAPQNVALALGDIDGLVVSDPFARLPEGFQEVVVESSDIEGRRATITYSIGWGDCFVECEGRHFWTVDVTADSATLRIEWGEPIPSDVLAQWQEPNPNR